VVCMEGEEGKEVGSSRKSDMPHSWDRKNFPEKEEIDNPKKKDKGKKTNP